MISMKKPLKREEKGLDLLLILKISWKNLQWPLNIPSSLLQKFHKAWKIMKIYLSERFVFYSQSIFRLNTYNFI